AGAYVPLERPASVIVLKELHGTPRELQRNGSASLLDLGDGVLGLEFHSKANALDNDLVAMGYAALEALDRPEWAGLVVGNQGEHFSLGANLMLVGLAAQAGQFGQVEALVRQFQDLALLMRYSAKPVVTAPFGRTLGGGAETALAGARIVAAAETYLGLVEFGVGLIPAGGGCKEVVRRLVAPHVAEGANLLPHLQRAFETIGFAKVSESAHQARELGFLTAGDRIVLNPAELIGEAKREVLQLVQAGYAPPARERVVYALGQRGQAALTAGIHTLRWGNYISDHDKLIALKLAHVLSGGDLSAPAWVPEPYFLDLEREAFLSLLGEPLTQARIAHMLQTGKPLRN
ncbi:MAG: enoyl-CoA hydratase/isomerase family protein, partial [Anaerolineales bacterium]|nr:enoyl-CoA hydratase/isomerase family protein [Anaerolineales bacterium]